MVDVCDPLGTLLRTSLTSLPACLAVIVPVTPLPRPASTDPCITWPVSSSNVARLCKRLAVMGWKGPIVFSASSSACLISGSASPYCKQSSCIVQGQGETIGSPEAK